MITDSYRLIYTHLVSGDILGEMPIQSVSCNWTLDSGGDLTATMPLSLSDNVTLKLTGQTPKQELSLEEHGIALYLERNGVILWGGMLNTIEASISDETLTVGALGWHNYLRRRYLTTNRVYAATDQLEIVRLLIEYTKAASLGVDIDTTALLVGSGVLRDRTYYGYELSNIGELIEQLAGVDDGFDFRYESQWSGGDIVNKFIPIYPALGRMTEHVFSLGVNVELLNYTADLSTVVNRALMVGSGEGDEMIWSTTYNTLMMTPKWPLLEEVYTHKTVTDSITLYKHSRKYLTRGSEAGRQLTLSVHTDSVPELGSYVEGDIVTISGSYGYINLNGLFRIVSRSLSVDESGDESSEIVVTSFGVFNNTIETSIS